MNDRYSRIAALGLNSLLIQSDGFVRGDEFSKQCPIRDSPRLEVLGSPKICREIETTMGVFGLSGSIPLVECLRVCRIFGSVRSMVSGEKRTEQRPL